MLCREQEAKIPAFVSVEHPSDALQIRHYKEALRRSHGYAKNCDLLFGFF